MMNIMCRPMENANHVAQIVIAAPQQQIAKVVIIDIMCPMENANHVTQIAIVAPAQQQIV